MGDGGHAGQARDALARLAEEGHALLLVVTLEAEVEGDAEQVLRLEAGIGLARGLQAAQEEAGADGWAPRAGGRALWGGRGGGGRRGGWGPWARGMGRTGPTRVTSGAAPATPPSRALGFPGARASGSRVTLRPLLSFGYSVSSR